MSITIGSNLFSLKGLGQLDRADSAASTALERLSSGQRINRPSDDAAALAIADSLRATTRVFNQRSRNLNDAISALSIADGALTSLGEALTRINELAEQSANEVFSHSQRKALQAEVTALKNEYNRIVQTTSFNGASLLDAYIGTVQMYAGDGSAGVIRLDLTSAIQRSWGQGTFDSVFTISDPGPADNKTMELADVNNDGFADVIYSSLVGSPIDTGVRLSNGDGTFRGPEILRIPGGVAGGYTGYKTPIIGDFNGDGKLDILQPTNVTAHNGYLYLGNGNGTFGAATTLWIADSGEVTIADVDNDGDLDIMRSSSDAIRVALNNGNGTFLSPLTFYTGGAFGVSEHQVAAADINNDGNVDLVASHSTNGIRVLLGNGDGSFGGPTAFATGGRTFGVFIRDVDRDGIMDVIAGTDTTTFRLLGNGDGTFRSSNLGISDTEMLADINGDGYEDLIQHDHLGVWVKASLNHGNGTFSAPATIIASLGSSVAGGFYDTANFGDIDGDGDLDMVMRHEEAFVVYSNRDNFTTRLPYLSVSTPHDARALLEYVGAARTRVELQRSAVGSALSRLTRATEQISGAALQQAAAESRLRDSDVAVESAALVAATIRKQIASALLAQANQQPRIALQLLDL